MKEIVWVHGASAAGKATFIRHVTSGDSEVLRQTLGWQGKVIAACQESIEWVGKYVGDPVVERRARLISRVQEMIEHADVALIKGQSVDLVANRPNQLLAATPECRHRVIYITTSIAELMQRLPQKPWWDGTDTEKSISTWVYYELTLLQSLDPQFEFTAIDGSSGNSYSLAQLPAQLQKV
jgi:hypothetical protein